MSRRTQSSAEERDANGKTALIRKRRDTMQESKAVEATRDFALAVAAGIVPVTRGGDVRLAVRKPLFSLLPVGEMVGRMTQARRQSITEYNALIAVRNRRQALHDRRAVEMFEYLAARGYTRAKDMLVAFGVRQEDIEDGGEMETVAQFQQTTFPAFERWQTRPVVESAWTAMAVANVCMLAALPQTGRELAQAVADVERASLFFGMARGVAVSIPADVEETGYAGYRLGRERLFEELADGAAGAEAVFAFARIAAGEARTRWS